jgi:threonyl-tRNA synthetase
LILANAHQNSASYFLGDAANDSLQRIYGVSFPDKKQMDEHKKYLEEAAKRDHRRIGKDQELFFFHDYTPGCCFFMPHGMIIYNTLQAFLREEYWKRGYQEVMSPNMYNVDLWKRSGHWQHYKDDMFTFDVEKTPWALKPMNCPGHCLMFAHRDRSWRELPIRMADFGVLHRNEASGALTGLTRVRRFQQDDCHIFCAEDQIEKEITDLFDFLATVYGKFGFTFKMKLSTRPDDYLGKLETWEIAEKRLSKALDEFTAKGNAQWELNPGDGAFYGPKIDITISDALKREFQCATIQLDFQLPIRFNLEFQTNEQVSKDKAVEGAAKPEAKPEAKEADKKADGSAEKELPPGYQRPVMIHRAIYGSFERFIAILTEHFAGKWPFWLSPRQILIIPVMPSANDYVLEVQKLFRENQFHADVDIGGNTMQKKIRTGQLQQYNFIFGKLNLFAASPHTPNEILIGRLQLLALLRRRPAPSTSATAMTRLPRSSANSCLWTMPSPSSRYSATAAASSTRCRALHCIRKVPIGRCRLLLDSTEKKNVNISKHHLIKLWIHVRLRMW